jgi:hypothetical protein
MRKLRDYEAIPGAEQEGKRAIVKTESGRFVGRRDMIILRQKVPEGRHTVAHRETVGKLSMKINEPRRGDTWPSQPCNHPNIHFTRPICSASVTLLH